MNYNVKRVGGKNGFIWCDDGHNLILVCFFRRYFASCYVYDYYLIILISLDTKNKKIFQYLLTGFSLELIFSMVVIIPSHSRQVLVCSHAPHDVRSGNVRGSIRI